MQMIMHHVVECSHGSILSNCFTGHVHHYVPPLHSCYGLLCSNCSPPHLSACFQLLHSAHTSQCVVFPRPRSSPLSADGNHSRKHHGRPPPLAERRVQSQEPTPLRAGEPKPGAPEVNDGDTVVHAHSESPAAWCDPPSPDSPRSSLLWICCE